MLNLEALRRMQLQQERRGVAPDPLGLRRRGPLVSELLDGYAEKLGPYAARDLFPPKVEPYDPRDSIANVVGKLRGQLTGIASDDAGYGVMESVITGLGKINEYKEDIDATREYTGGLFDGILRIGNVNYNASGGPTYRIYLNMAHQPLRDGIGAMFPDIPISERKESPNVWEVSSRANVLAILEKLEPYLVLKKEAARILIDHLRLVEASKMPVKDDPKAFRLAEQLARELATPKTYLQNTSPAYLAGYIDAGNGQVSLVVDKRNASGAPDIRLRLASVHPAITDAFVRAFGIGKSTPYRQTRNIDEHIYRVSGVKAAKVLRMLLPHLMFRGEDFVEKLDRFTSARV